MPVWDSLTLKPLLAVGVFWVLQKPCEGVAATVLGTKSPEFKGSDGECAGGDSDGHSKSEKSCL